MLFLQCDIQFSKHPLSTNQGPGKEVLCICDLQQLKETGVAEQMGTRLETMLLSR